MDIMYFLNTINCNSCKYNILCQHNTNKEPIIQVCYYWLNQKTNYPKKQEDKATWNQ